jgi:hypothetical protein
VAALRTLAPEAGPDRAVTRRQLIAWGATTAVVASLPRLVASPRAVAQGSWLRRAGYTGRIGQAFRASAGDATTVDLRLEAVRDLAGTTPGGATLAARDDAFLLELRGPVTPRLGQGVFELRHPALGRKRLFLVPQAPEAHGTSYVVVVNRAAR